MRRASRVAALSLVLCVVPTSGCTVDPDCVEDPTLAKCQQTEPCEDETGLTVEDPVNAQACPNRVWIGCTQSADCPAAGTGWEVTKLFEADGGGFPSAAEAFCVYEWTGEPMFSVEDLEGTGNDVLERLERLPPDGDICQGSWLQRDCRVVAPLGLVNADLRDEDKVILAAQREHFLGQLDRPPADAWDGLVAQPGIIQVAVLDAAQTVPQSFPAPQAWDHGVFVHKLLEELACGDKACTSIADRQVLTGNAPSDADQKGGAYGTLSELSRGLFETWQDWRAGNTQRLVVNLSLGWAKQFLEVPVPPENTLLQSRCAVKAVEVALERLACDGALVFAAAGNRRLTEDDQGPSYPAAWEEVLAPDAARCQEILGDEATSGAGDRPLINAVQGVDSAGVVLSKAPVGGLTRLVAPGAQASLAPLTLDDTSAGGTVLYHLPAFTGSSVAAAVASGVAASVWALDPTLTAETVLALVYNGGAELKAVADFCVGDEACPGVRRVSQCGALNELAAAKDSPIPLDHPIVLECESVLAEPPAALDTKGTYAILDANTDDHSQGDPTMSEALVLDTLGDPILDPFKVDPQPGRTPCGVCNLFVGDADPATDIAVGDLYVYVDPAITGLAIRNAEIGLRFDGTSQVFTVPLEAWMPEGGLVAGSRTLLRGISIDTQNRPIASAELISAVQIDEGAQRAALDAVPLNPAN